MELSNSDLAPVLEDNKTPHKQGSSKLKIEDVRGHGMVDQSIYVDTQSNENLRVLQG